MIGYSKKELPEQVELKSKPYVTLSVSSTSFSPTSATGLKIMILVGITTAQI
jgi:hypothetical protein